MLCRVTGILWGQLNRLTIGRRCWAKLLAWRVRLIRNINCRRMRFELMNRRRPQYISITILPRGLLIRLRKIGGDPIKENIQGYIESLGFHVIASIPGLSISKKDRSGCLGDNFSLNCAGIWTKHVHPNTRKCLMPIVLPCSSKKFVRCRCSFFPLSYPQKKGERCPVPSLCTSIYIARHKGVQSGKNLRFFKCIHSRFSYLL